jgi:hypothetical protein
MKNLQIQLNRSMQIPRYVSVMQSPSKRIFLGYKGNTQIPPVVIGFSDHADIASIHEMIHKYDGFPRDVEMHRHGIEYEKCCLHLMFDKKQDADFDTASFNEIEVNVHDTIDFAQKCGDHGVRLAIVDSIEIKQKHLFDKICAFFRGCNRDCVVCEMDTLIHTDPGEEVYRNTLEKMFDESTDV